MPLALQGLPLLVGPLFSVTHSESAEDSAHGRCSVRERSAGQSMRGTCWGWQVVPPGAGGIPLLGAPAPLARHVSERPLLAASTKLPGLSLSLLA